MGIIKNEVGRPSNDTLKKRRILKVLGGVLLFVLVIGIVLIVSKKVFNIDLIEGNNKKATLDYGIEVIDNTKELTRNTNEFGIRFKYTKAAAKMYYRVDSYSNKGYSSLVNGNTKIKYGSCKSIKIDKYKQENLSTANNTTTWLVGGLYTDSKCKNKVASFGSKRNFTDSKAPTVSKACKKDGYVYLTANDNVNIHTVAWVQRGIECSSVLLSSRETVDKKSLTNYKIKAKITTSKNIKVCLWDLVGREEAEWVSNKC